MGHAALKSNVSPEEYLDFERKAPERHEYADGEIFAMSGGTREHSLIASNLNGELRYALMERRCEVHTSDMRIKTPTGRYFYSDVLVVCGRPIFEDDKRDTLLNPLVIVEVLSDSTESYDRGEKFAHYRSLDSLQDYILVSQHQVLIEHFTRQPDNTWLLRVLGPGEQLSLPSIECAIAVDRAYLKVFDKEA